MNHEGAIVLGDRGAGTTTFLGLLYAALVRWGSAEREAARVHADAGTLRSIKGVYASLVDGRFPPPELECGPGDLTFLVELPGSRRWALAPARGRELGVHLSDLEEFAELKGRALVLDEWLRTRLGSRIAVVLVDASRIPERTGEQVGATRLFRRFDLMVASSLGLLATYRRTDQPRGRSHLRPIFVLTKFDLLDPRAFPEALPPLGTARRAWGSHLLSERMPQTWGLFGGSLPGVRFDPPEFFVSWVRSEASPSGGSRIRRRERPPLGGWEPDYPYLEFLGLLRSLQGKPVAYRDLSAR